MIQVKDLHKSFGNLHVLQGVNLQVEKGEIVAILGRSGAGKTTLLQIIGTLDTPDSGQVVIDGKNVFDLSEQALSAFRNEHIGFIFQQHQLLPEFTALENVMLPGLIAHKKENDIRERALILLTQLGLQDRVEHKPHELSGGEQQRIVIARALLNSPEIILADEPTGNLDPATAWAIRLGVWAIALLITFAVIIVIPDKNLGYISVIGANTLNIYFWHRPICYWINGLGLFPAFIKTYYYVSERDLFSIYNVIKIIVLREGKHVSYAVVSAVISVERLDFIFSYKAYAYRAEAFI